MRASLIIALLLSACAVTSTRTLVPRGSATIGQCIDLMDKRDNTELAAGILAGVGGVSALTTAPDAVPEPARWAIGATAAASTAVSLVLLKRVDTLSDEFDMICSIEETEIGTTATDGGVE